MPYIIPKLMAFARERVSESMPSSGTSKTSASCHGMNILALVECALQGLFIGHMGGQAQFYLAVIGA